MKTLSLKFKEENPVHFKQMISNFSFETKSFETKLKKWKMKSLNFESKSNDRIPQFSFEEQIYWMTLKHLPTDLGISLILTIKVQTQ